MTFLNILYNILLLLFLSICHLLMCLYVCVHVLTGHAKAVLLNQYYAQRYKGTYVRYLSFYFYLFLFSCWSGWMQITFKKTKINDFSHWLNFLLFRYFWSIRLLIYLTDYLFIHFFIFVFQAVWSYDLMTQTLRKKKKNMLTI